MTCRKRKIERTVLNCLRDVPSTLVSFPIDIMAIIEHHKNCKVHTYQAFALANGLSVDDVIAFSQSETGCTHTDARNYIIMYNDSHLIPIERKIFTLAHELGHVLLNHFDYVVAKKIAQSEIHSDAMEREANYFAACILCPMPIVSRVKPSSAVDLQRIFRLSAEASRIAWNDYVKYSRTYHIAWHNDMIRLFAKATVS